MKQIRLKEMFQEGSNVGLADEEGEEGRKERIERNAARYAYIEGMLGAKLRNLDATIGHTDYFVPNAEDFIAHNEYRFFVRL